MISARLATGLHPIGALLLALFGPVMAVPFVLLHGAGNGMLTIARGTLPLALFGPAGYGLRTGLSLGAGAYPAGRRAASLRPRARWQRAAYGPAAHGLAHRSFLPRPLHPERGATGLCARSEGADSTLRSPAGILVATASKSETNTCRTLTLRL